MFSLRSFILALVAALTAGAALGVLAPLLEMTSASPGHVAHLVLDAGWSWAALAFCAGLARKSRIESVILAPASLIAAVIAYYVTKLERGEILAAGLNDPAFLTRTVGWSLAAAILGPILGLAGNLAMNRGFRGLPFRVLIPVMAIVETSQRIRFEASRQEAIAGTTWNATRLIAVAVVIVLVGHTVIKWWPRSSVGKRETSA